MAMKSPGKDEHKSAVGPHPPQDRKPWSTAVWTAGGISGSEKPHANIEPITKGREYDYEYDGVFDFNKPSLA